MKAKNIITMALLLTLIINTTAINKIAQTKIDYTIQELIDSNNPVETAKQYGLQLSEGKIKIEVIVDENTTLEYPELAMKEETTQFGQKSIIGTIPIEKLEELAEKEEVLFILPYYDFNAPTDFNFETTFKTPKIDPILSDLQKSDNQEELAQQFDLEIKNGKVKTLIYADNNTALKCCEIETIKTREESGAIEATAWIPIEKLNETSKSKQIHYISAYNKYTSDHYTNISFELIELIKASEENRQKIINKYGLITQGKKIKIEIIFQGKKPESIKCQETTQKTCQAFASINKITELSKNKNNIFIYPAYTEKKPEEEPVLPKNTPPQNPQQTHTENKTQGIPLWTYPIAISLALFSIAAFKKIQQHRRTKM